MGNSNVFFLYAWVLCLHCVLAIFLIKTSSQHKYLCIQKPLVSHPYKNLMTFGGCKQDFMLVVGQSISTNTGKDKPTEKHLFATDTSKVGEIVAAEVRTFQGKHWLLGIRLHFSDIVRKVCHKQTLFDEVPSSAEANHNTDFWRLCLVVFSSTDQGDHPPHLQLHQ